MRQNYTWFYDYTWLLLLIAGFFAILLGTHNLFVPDEGRYAEIAREMLVSGHYLTPHLNGLIFLDKPILFYWLQTIPLRLFGISAWSLRLMPALFGVFGCLFTYTAGRIIFNRRSAILAALLLASSPLYYIMAHYVNMDLEVAVLISCALFSFMIAVKKENSVWMYLAYIFAAFAVLTKGLIGIAFPVMIIGAWMLFFRQWQILKKMHIVSGLLFLFIIAAPWYILAERANPDFWHYFFVVQQFSRYLTHHFNCHQPFYFYIGVILIGMLPWSLFLPQAMLKRNKEPLEWFLLLWPLLILLFFSIPRSKLVGYITPVAPPLALLVGVYLDKIWQELAKKAWLILAILLALLCVLLPSLVAKLAPVSSHFYLLAVVFLASALVTLRAKKMITIIAAMMLAIALVLLIGMHAVPKLNLPTTKPIAAKLKTILRPNDKVVTFYDYYQDLPLYLNKKVYVVNDWHKLEYYKRDNWKRKFMVGWTFEGSDHTYLLTQKKLLNMWRNNKRIFIIAGQDQYKKLQELLQDKLYILFYWQKKILLAKSPCFTADKSK